MTRKSPPEGKVRFAVVGLGHIAQVAVLPGFAHAANAELAALVSGTEEKRKTLAERYGVRHTAGYDDLEDLLTSGAIDAVYLATPNHLHCEQTLLAAKHGVHVLCEKPMAVTEEECERMRQACEDAGVKLMIAYRLHFDRPNLEAIAIARKELGELRYFSSVFSQAVKAGDIRTDAIERGGGSLYDIGIYCINAARYLFRDEPVEVFAMMKMATDPERKTEYDQTVGAVLRFSDHRIASITTCFDAVSRSSYRIVGTDGDLRMEPAYGYSVNLAYQVTVGGDTRTERFPVHDQFGPQLHYFADCVLHDRHPEPDWREGLADVRIIRALHRSAREGRPVAVQPVPDQNRPDLDQVIERPAVQEPEVVAASSPKRK